MWKRWKYKLTHWYESDMSLWWNVKSLWGTLTHPFTRTYHWLVKSVQYAIFLWPDFDWDHSYIFTLLQYKLKRTRKRILANDMISSADLVALQIKHAEDLIQRYMDNNFCAEEYEAHEKKWGKIKDFTKPSTSYPGMYEWDPTREKVTTEEEKKQERAEQHKIYEMQEKAKQECLDEIFSHIRKYIEGWWD